MHLLECGVCFFDSSGEINQLSSMHRQHFTFCDYHLRVIYDAVWLTSSELICSFMHIYIYSYIYVSCCAYFVHTFFIFLNDNIYNKKRGRGGGGQMKEKH
jgi:hypothetical protein